MIVPGFLTYYAVLGSIGVIAAVLLAMRCAPVDAGWPVRERSQAIAVTGVVLAGWLAATAVLATLGTYQAVSDRIPTIQLGVLVPVLVGIWAYWRVPAVARLLDAVPQQWLVGIQIYRVLGAIFIVLFAAGSLPGLFALPAGLGDLAVGLLAPLVALAYARSPHASAGKVLAWNMFGLGDFVLAFATGFATSPSAFQLAAFDNPNVLIATFPLVLIPVFLVPLSILLHLASLAKLRQAHRQDSQPNHANAARA